MKAVILAGGRGTRLYPYTTILPKPLMPLGDIPILEIVLQQLSLYGFTEAILAVGYLSEIIKAYFGNKRVINGLKITYIDEEIPLGTIGPIKEIRGLNKTFLVMNGDILTTLDYVKMLKFHRGNKSDLTLAIHNRSVNINYGVIDVDSDNIVQGHKEKPILDYKVGMGIRYFEPRALDFIKAGERLDFPDLLLRMKDGGQKIMAYESKDYWMDIGRQDDYQQAVEDIDSLMNKILRKNKESVSDIISSK